MSSTFSELRHEGLQVLDEILLTVFGDREVAIRGHELVLDVDDDESTGLGWCGTRTRKIHKSVRFERTVFVWSGSSARGPFDVHTFFSLGFMWPGWAGNGVLSHCVRRD